MVVEKLRKGIRDMAAAATLEVIKARSTHIMDD